MDQRIIDVVIPQLTAFKAIMRIRDIQLTKEKEAKAEKIKAERLGITKQPSTTEVAADKDMSKMTTKEIMATRLQEEEKESDEHFMTEQ